MTDDLRKEIEEAVSNFFDEGECTHASVVCGATIHNDPAHCSQCIITLILSRVEAQIKKDAGKSCFGCKMNYPIEIKDALRLHRHSNDNLRACDARVILAQLKEP